MKENNHPSTSRKSKLHFVASIDIHDKPVALVMRPPNPAVVLEVVQLVGQGNGGSTFLRVMGYAIGVCWADKRWLLETPRKAMFSEDERLTYGDAILNELADVGVYDLETITTLGRLCTDKCSDTISVPTVGEVADREDFTEADAGK